MGKKSAANLVAQIERSKTREFWRLIYGLGIRHVGERGAQALAGAFGTMDALIGRVARAASGRLRYRPRRRRCRARLLRPAAEPGS